MGSEAPIDGTKDGGGGIDRDSGALSRGIEGGSASDAHEKRDAALDSGSTASPDSGSKADVGASEDAGMHEADAGMHDAAIHEDAAAGSFNPEDPGAAGYSIKFPSTGGAFDISKIDVNNTGAAGYDWYVTYFNNEHVTPAAALTVNGGVLTINPTACGTGMTIQSTTDGNHATTGYEGSVFGGGWYIEASISFNASDPYDGCGDGWPAFVAYAIENQRYYYNGQPTKQVAHWPGQVADYSNEVENDMFEWQNQPNRYGATLHDWFGYLSAVSPPCSGHAGYCNDDNNSNSDINLAASGDAGTVNWGPSHFNTIGQLWVPGSAENGWKGSITNYFNGIERSTVTWVNQGNGSPSKLTGTQFSPNNIASTGTFAFSVMDSMHYYPILQAGFGQALNAQWVRIWQLSSGTQAVSTAYGSGSDYIAAYPGQ
jgi:hypothetical protein